MSIFHLKFKLVRNLTTFHADQESSDYKTLVRAITDKVRGLKMLSHLKYPSIRMLYIYLYCSRLVWGYTSLIELWSNVAQLLKMWSLLKFTGSQDRNKTSHGKQYMFICLFHAHIHSFVHSIAQYELHMKISFVHIDNNYHCIMISCIFHKHVATFFSVFVKDTTKFVKRQLIGNVQSYVKILDCITHLWRYRLKSSSKRCLRRLKPRETPMALFTFTWINFYQMTVSWLIWELT